MTQPIGIGNARAAGVGAVCAIGPAGGALAQQTMAILATRVAGTLTQALGLVQATAAPLAAVDPYGVETMARELAAALNAGPADAGRLSRALNDFTSEVASLVAASPTSDALDRLSRLGDGPAAPERRPGWTDAEHALATIDTVIAQLRGPR